MTNVTVQLSDREIAALKARTGKRSAAAALKAWQLAQTQSVPLLSFEPLSRTP
jgi:hypothetical protein